MARLTRVTHKQFAENAPIVESGSTQVEIGQFGSALAGTYVATNDVATLQALPAYSRGWGGAVIAEEQLPTIEDMNAVQRVQSYQTGYLFQEGIAEYDANSEYGIGSLCKVINGANVKIYQSLINDNIGNPITDTNAWQEFTIGGDLYVKKSGDTMTGDLTIEDSDPYLNFKDRTTDSSVAPSTFQNLGSVFVRDKNHQVTGYFQNSMTAQNLVQTTIGARRRIDETELTSSLALAVDSSGTALFAFPQCTTKPTTTSSAKSNKVAVVIQNYLNGSSWYRVWSDGFIEQGGAIQNANTPISITFAKTFTDANSVRVLFDVVNTGNTQAYCLNEIPTVSGFKIFRYGGSMTTPYANWYACGY